MKIITISREFGSGGRELGKRLADLLHFDYYDNEIIAAIAQNNGLDADYVEKQLDSHGWQSIPLTYRSSFYSAHTANAGNIALLVEQKKVIEKIASLGKDCVIVGRNADVILKDYHPLHIFVCADKEAKIRRCLERAPEGEHLTEKELVQKMKQIDKNRARTREILTNAAWGQRDSYHLTINTSEWDIKELAQAVSDFANSWFRRS